MTVQRYFFLVSIYWFALLLLNAIGLLVSYKLLNANDILGLNKIVFIATESIFLLIPAILLALITNWTIHNKYQRLFFDILVFLPLTYFLLISWISYGLLGGFLDHQVITMVKSDGIQLIEHAQDILSPIWLMFFFIPFFLLVLIHFLRSQVLMNNKKSLWLVIGVLCLCMLSGMIIHIQAHNKLNTYSQSHDWLALHHSGPLNYLIKSLFAHYRNRPISKNTAGLLVNYHPQLSMDQFVNQQAVDEMKRYNVIVLLIESFRKNALTPYGSQKIIMPNVEAIMSESLIFENAYSHSSHSNYADLAPLSSHYPLRSKSIHVYPPNPSYPRVLFYDILKKLGYRTAIFSSQNESWGGMENYLKTGSLDQFFHSGLWKGEIYRPFREPTNAHNLNFDDYIENMTKGKRSGKIDDAITVKSAIHWIKHQHNPFAMYMNLQNSHIPFRVPPNYPRPFFSGDEKELDAVNSGKIMGISIDRVEEAYHDALHYIDTQVGHLVTTLKEQGLWDNTVLIISADTSMLLSKHGMLGNGFDLFEEVVNVPLIIRIPDGHIQKVDKFVQHIDIPPTINTILGLQTHPAWQGMNMINSDDSTDYPIFMVAQTPFVEQYSIVFNKKKLIYDAKLNQYSVYDIINDDPNRAKIIKSPSKELLKDMSEKLFVWMNDQIRYYDNEKLQQQVYPPSFQLKD